MGIQNLGEQGQVHLVLKVRAFDLKVRKVVANYPPLSPGDLRSWVANFRSPESVCRPLRATGRTAGPTKKVGPAYLDNTFKVSFSQHFKSFLFTCNSIGWGCRA